MDEVKNFKQQMIELRTDLRRVIDDRLRRFAEETGVVVTSLRVEMIETSTVNKPSSTVGSINIGFDL